MTANSERRDYDIGASQDAQENFNRVAARLEGLIDQRDKDVQAAMSDYLADGVSDDYRAKELRWKNAASEVRTIIRSLREALERNDESASDALRRARTAVENIG